MTFHICAGCHQPMKAAPRRTCSASCARGLARVTASLHRSAIVLERTRAYWLAAADRTRPDLNHAQAKPRYSARAEHTGASAPAVASR